MPVSLDQLEKSHAALKQAVAVDSRVALGQDQALIETTRSGVIQNFKVAYEQSWKILRRWLMHHQNIADADITQRKQLYRLAAKHGLIQEVEAWWEFQTARNLTSHTYNQTTAIDVARMARLFEPACAALIAQLKSSAQDD